MVIVRVMRGPTNVGSALGVILDGRRITVSSLAMLELIGVGNRIYPGPKGRGGEIREKIGLTPEFPGFFFDGCRWAVG